ncbi:hypothetical protein EV424DRAFT_1348676 [Suillus variegatus]|nr:hypothetical protein EV424DRAFT_1348676 [Suillus variegatus]
MIAIETNLFVTVKMAIEDNVLYFSGTSNPSHGCLVRIHRRPNRRKRLTLWRRRLQQLRTGSTSAWLHRTPLIKTSDKHYRGFMNNAYGKLICPAEWSWEDPVIRAGICDRATAFIVSENSWPLGKNHRQDLTSEVISRMSEKEDNEFNSD